MVADRRPCPIFQVRVSLPVVGSWRPVGLVVAICLTGSGAAAQAVTECGFPDLTAGEVVTATGLAGAYLGVCWLGRILLRMMT